MNLNTISDIIVPERVKVRQQGMMYVLAGALLTLSAIVTFRAACALASTPAWLVLLSTSIVAGVAAAVSVRVGLAIHRLADEFSHLASVRDRVGPFVVTVEHPVVQSHDYGTRFSLTTPARVRIERDPTWMQ